MHKSPIGSRFIAASHACTTKPLSHTLTICLKAITKHYKQYCEGIFRNTGVNCFWIIDNSTQVLRKLQELNSCRNAKHFDSFDFSTLYTNIPHDLLLQCLTELITEAYRIRGATYLAVSSNEAAYWTNIASPKNHNIVETALIEHITYLVNNVYIQAGDRVFRQAIGIPMGTDCAPLLANLFLFYYEFKFMKDKIKTNHRMAKRFSNTFRYIDDLLSLNNPGFEDEISNIYPPQLKLKRTTEAIDRLSYLDLDLSIRNETFSSDVFDKRDAFNFHIVNYPHLDGNIPSKPAYGVYISQLVRIGRICDSYDGFQNKHYKLTKRLVKQGFVYEKLVFSFKKFCRKYPHIFSKFGVSLRKHVDDGVCLPLVAIQSLSKNIVTNRQ